MGIGDHVSEVVERNARPLAHVGFGYEDHRRGQRLGNCHDRFRATVPDACVGEQAIDEGLGVGGRHAGRLCDEDLHERLDLVGGKARELTRRLGHHGIDQNSDLRPAHGSGLFNKAIDQVPDLAGGQGL